MSQHRSAEDKATSIRMTKPMRKPFRFAQFSVTDRHCGHRVGTDAVLLAAWVRDSNDARPRGNCVRRLLDVGTGCGVIALLMAQRFTASQVDAIEMDPVATAEAADNFRRSPWPDRMRAIHTRFEDFVDAASSSPAKYDAVVCNPPFFSRATAPRDLRRRRSRHSDTLDWATVMKGCATLLSAEGTLNLIVPASEECSLRTMASRLSGSLTRLCHVSPREGSPPNRMLVAFCPHKTARNDQIDEVASLSIRHCGSDTYTDAFWGLCRDLYLPTTAHAPVSQPKAEDQDSGSGKSDGFGTEARRRNRKR